MVYAYELTGYGITNEIHTQIEFKKIKENNAGITFDSAILIFENAPKNMSLEITTKSLVKNSINRLKSSAWKTRLLPRKVHGKIQSPNVSLAHFAENAWIT